MNSFMKDIYNKIRDSKRLIAFTEYNDSRVIEAVKIIMQKRLAIPVLVGKKSSIELVLKKNSFRHKPVIVDVNDNSLMYAEQLFKLRKNKLNLTQAKRFIKNPMYYAVMLLYNGVVDGVVSGATHTTAETVRPALQVIPKQKLVSSFFIMIIKKRVLFFADSAINILPDAKGLAQIAISTAESASLFGFTPRVALLSFSTKGSAKHPLVTKVRRAVNIVKRRKPNLIVDGEMQVDAALVPEINKRKCSNCRVKGNANVLIFPDLQSGNISYKLVQRLAGATAIGPIIQGFSKPVNDLSRGCSVEDIVNVTAITALQAMGVK